MPNPVQRSFGRGEISPALSARADLDLYKAALSTQRNFITPKSGGVQNRPGTEFVGASYYPVTTSTTYLGMREVPFVFSADDAYALVFGHLYMSVIRNGSFVTEASKNIASVSVAAAAVVTCTAHGYSDGDQVYIVTSKFTGMPEIGSLTFTVSSATADTFQIIPLSDQAASNIDSSTYAAYVSGGTVARVYRLTTVFTGEEVSALGYAQFRDVMVLTHPSHPQQLLTRLGHASWTIADVQIGTRGHAYALAGVKGGAGSNQTRYKITYIDASTGKESKPGTEASKGISNITKANPAVVTCTGHGYSTGDTVLIHNVAGMTEVNYREFIISVPSAYTPDSPKTIASITQAGPMVVTSTAHGYSNGDQIAFTVTGMLELNDITYGTVVVSAANTFQVYYYGTTTKIDSTGFAAFVAGTVLRISPNPTATSTFSLVGVDSTNYGAYVASPFDACGRTCLTLSSAADATVAAPNVLTWSGILPTGSWISASTSGVLNYVIYKELGGIFGKVGVSTTTSFSDVGFDIDTSSTPIEYTELFLTAGSYPAHVAFHQQRLIFSNSTNEPETIWMSRVGDYYNFCKRTFILDDDPITATIAGNNVDPVRALVPMRVLLCMSQSSEVVAEGTLNESFAPGAVSIHPDSHNGSGSVKPVVVNNAVLYTQKDLRVLRDLFYNFQSNSYDGSDLSALAAHLFRDGTIVDMAYQKSPNSILWLVRSDGVLVSCTYVKEQSILAFATHDLAGGEALGACCIPEGDETALYLIVKHSHGTRFIERLSSRTIADPEDITGSVFVDCALGYDGSHGPDPADGDYAKVTSGTTYAAGEFMRCHTTAVQRFAASDVGNTVVLNGNTAVTVGGTALTGSDTLITCVITAYVDSQNVVVQPNKDIPAALQNVYCSGWGLGIGTIGGLWHLEGQEVSVTGDGWVVANPNNDSYSVLTVSSGRVTLPEQHVIIWGGLPYVSDLQTCDLENINGPSLMSQSKLVKSVTCYVNDTREFWAGESLPDDDSKTGLKPSRQHVTGEETDEPPALFSEPVDVNIKAKWNKGGRVCIRNIDPLPCEIIAISPEFHVGS